MMFHFSQIKEALVECDEPKLTQLVKDELDQDVPAADILNKGLIEEMDLVGEKMENEDMFIPEVLWRQRL